SPGHEQGDPAKAPEAPQNIEYLFQDLLHQNLDCGTTSTSPGRSSTFCLRSPPFTRSESFTRISRRLPFSMRTSLVRLPAANWLNPPTASTASSTFIPSRYAIDCG